jgi:hypothetical protein
MQQITAQAFAAKFNSKREVYRFLSHEVGAYVAPFETMTVWHLRDLASNQRRIMKSTNIKIMQLPHFEGLTIDAMLVWAVNWR